MPCRCPLLVLKKGNQRRCPNSIELSIYTHVNPNPSDQSDRRHPDSSNPRAFSIGCGDSKRPLPGKRTRWQGNLSYHRYGTSLQLGCLPLHYAGIICIGMVSYDALSHRLRLIFRHSGSKTCDPNGPLIVRTVMSAATYLELWWPVRYRKEKKSGKRRCLTHALCFAGICLLPSKTIYSSQPCIPPSALISS